MTFGIVHFCDLVEVEKFFFSKGRIRYSAFAYLLQGRKYTERRGARIRDATNITSRSRNLYSVN